MKVIRWLDKHFEEALMIILLIIVTVVMIAQVLLRYIFDSPLYWAEEFCRYGLVWSTFVSIGYCIRYQINLHVDLLDKVMPKALRTVVQYFIKLVCLAFYVVVFYGAWKYHEQSMSAGQRSAAMQVPIYLLQIVIVPGSFMGVVRQVQDIVLYTLSVFKSGRQGQRGG